MELFRSAVALKTYCSLCLREANYDIIFGYKCKRCSRAYQPFYKVSIKNRSWRCREIRKMVAKGEGYKIDAHSKAWGKS